MGVHKTLEMQASATIKKPLYLWSDVLLQFLVECNGHLAVCEFNYDASFESRVTDRLHTPRGIQTALEGSATL